jgi:hypothetical protein
MAIPKFLERDTLETTIYKYEQASHTSSHEWSYRN